MEEGSGQEQETLVATWTSREDPVRPCPVNLRMRLWGQSPACTVSDGGDLDPVGERLGLALLWTSGPEVGGA